MGRLVIQQFQPRRGPLPVHCCIWHLGISWALRTSWTSTFSPGPTYKRTRCISLKKSLRSGKRRLIGKEGCKTLVGQWAETNADFAADIPDALADDDVEPHVIVAGFRSDLGLIFGGKLQPLTLELQDADWDLKIILQQSFQRDGAARAMREQAAIIEQDHVFHAGQNAFGLRESLSVLAPRCAGDSAVTGYPNP